MTLQEAQEEVAIHMNEIVRLFKPGVKITIMIRTPGKPNYDFLMTDDDLSELHAMIDRRTASVTTP